MKYILIILILIPSYIFAQFDLTDSKNIIHYYSFGKEFEIFKNLKKNTFFITDENEKVLFKKLKHCERLNQRYIQALDKNNVIIYLNEILERIEKPKYVGTTVCGNGDIYHKLSIKNKQGKYIINLTTKEYFNKTDSIKTVLDSIEENGINKIYFINKERTYEFIYNTMSERMYPKFVIFEKDKKFGILDKGKEYFFNSLIIDSQYVKIENDGLWNYYHISPIAKFKRLDSFVYGLAYFELPNGKSGYLSKEGDEYYD